MEEHFSCNFIRNYYKNYYSINNPYLSERIDTNKIKIHKKGHKEKTIIRHFGIFLK